MTQENRTVRQWLSLYQAGTFESREPDDQPTAGWRRFSCRFDALPGRLRQIAPVVARIEQPFILDHYTIWYENVKCPNRKAVYDRAQFRPLDGGHGGLAFHLDFKNPDEMKKWVLYTERFSPAAPEYGCTSALQMAQYINVMARELEQGIRPPFLDEQAAVVRYALDRGALYSSGAVCRAGDHRYCFMDRSSQTKTVHVAHSLKDVPPEFQGAGTTKVHGLYVYCLEDTKTPPPGFQKASGTSQKKRRERER